MGLHGSFNYANLHNTVENAPDDGDESQEEGPYVGDIDAAMACRMRIGSSRHADSNDQKNDP